MAEPTKGPWYVEDVPLRHQRYRVKSKHQRGGNAPTTICAMGSSRPGRSSDHNPHEAMDAIDEANARLIAKARHLPAVVEALEHVISWWDRGLEDPFDIGKIRAALALVQETE